LRKKHPNTTYFYATYEISSQELLRKAKISSAAVQLDVNCAVMETFG